MIREVEEMDLDNLLLLYTQLHNNDIPNKTEAVIQLWEKIREDKNHHIIVAEEGERIVSSCVCVILPNLTHNQRPYALVENVITDINFRNMGFATKCLEFAKEIAVRENCYKIMLLTGSKMETTLDFYRRAGFNSADKTAFIQWI